MATLVSGDTLSLNNLAGATGNTQGVNVSLGAIRGGSGITTGLSSYAIDSVVGITGYTYAVEGTSENYQLTFTGEGSNFGQIKSHTPNFTWSIPVQGGYMSLGTNSGYIRTFSVASMNPQSPSAQSALQGIVSHTIRVNFADGYNDHIGSGAGYGVNKDKTVYSVDSYDGNSTALCLKSDTLVTLLDGTQVEIGDLEEGMQLKGYSLDGLDSSTMNMLAWSSDSLTPSEIAVNVVNVVFSFAERVYNINNGEIIATAEHPLVVKDSDGVFKFKVIHTIEVGDSLVKADGTTSLVESIILEEGTVEIVSLDVDGPDTYLANGYITHNKGGNTHNDLVAPSAPTSLGYSPATQFLTWVAPTAVGITGITAYEVQVDNNSDYSSPIISYNEFSTNSISLQGQGLGSGTNYARVRAIDQGLKGSWATLTFTF